MTATGSSAGLPDYSWQEGDAFAELTRLRDGWEVVYGFEGTGDRGRIVHARQTADDYEDAVRQLRQVIGYYFAEPEHAERVRRELLTKAGLDPGPSQYLPVPDNKYLTSAGGGAGAGDEVAADNARRARALTGEPAPPAAPAQGDQPRKRPWWKRLGG